MGGSKSSSSAATSQTDNRRVLGEGSISAENSTVTIQALDNGAINRAFDTADLSVKNALSFGANALSFASTAQEATLDSLNTTSELVKDAYQEAKGRGELTDQILIGAIAMAGLVAFKAVGK